MTGPKWVMLVYGLALIAMGVEAAVVKGSLVSLAAAGGAGALVVMMTVVAVRNPRVGYIVTLVVCLLLIGRFLPVYLQDSTKVYPALVTVVMSSIVALTLVGGHLLATGRKRADTD
jgi:hypothetical protein